MSAFHPKVTAGVVAGALTGLIIAEVNRRGITVAPDEAADLTVLLSFAAGWFMPSDDGAVPIAPAVLAEPAAPRPQPTQLQTPSPPPPPPPSI